MARRFVLVAVAGELATHYGLIGWQQGEAEPLQPLLETWGQVGTVGTPATARVAAHSGVGDRSGTGGDKGQAEAANDDVAAGGGGDLVPMFCPQVSPVTTRPPISRWESRITCDTFISGMPPLRSLSGSTVTWSVWKNPPIDATSATPAALVSWSRTHPSRTGCAARPGASKARKY